HCGGVGLDLLSKLERHVGFLDSRLVFNGPNGVVLNIEGESKLVAFKEIYVALMNEGNLAELLLVEMFLVDVEIESERLAEDGLFGRFLGSVVRRAGEHRAGENDEYREERLHGGFRCM